MGRMAARGGPVRREAALAVLGRLTRAMDRLEDALVAGRDLKPANVIAPVAPAPAGPPSCACGPMALRTRDAEGARFGGCSRWTSAGGGCGAKTIPLEGTRPAPSAPPAPPPDPEEERDDWPTGVGEGH